MLVAGERNHTVLDIVAQYVAQRAAEILVTRIAQERAAVGQHAHETTQQAEIRQGHHLFLHAVFLIEEPPAGTELDLTRAASVLEIAEHGGDNFIGTGIQVVKNGLGQVSFAVEFVQEMTHGFGGSELADRVESGVCAQFLEHEAVVVADSAVVELLCPTGLLIHDSHLLEESVFVFALLEHLEFLTRQSFTHDSVNLSVGVGLVVELLDTVIRQFAAFRSEEIVTFLQRCQQVGKRVDAEAGNLTQFLDISGPCGGFDVHRSVGTPCRNHAGLAALVCGYYVVILQRIDGVVRGADDLHVVVLHQAARRELRVVLNQLVAGVVDLAGGLRIQTFGDAESRLQLQVRPVVERVAESIGNGLGPFLELLPVGGVIARAIYFGNAVAAHCTPFVMVAHQPDLGNGFKTFVLCHHLRAEVTMVVDNRHLGRMLVV